MALGRERKKINEHNGNFSYSFNIHSIADCLVCNTEFATIPLKIHMLMQQLQMEKSTIEWLG